MVKVEMVAQTGEQIDALTKLVSLAKLYQIDTRYIESPEHTVAKVTGMAIQGDTNV